MVEKICVRGLNPYARRYRTGGEIWHDVKFVTRVSKRGIESALHAVRCPAAPIVCGAQISKKCKSLKKTARSAKQRFARAVFAQTKLPALCNVKFHAHINRHSLYRKGRFFVFFRGYKIIIIKVYIAQYSSKGYDVPTCRRVVSAGHSNPRKELIMCLI